MFGLRKICGWFKTPPAPNPLRGVGSRETFSGEDFCRPDYQHYSNERVLDIILGEGKKLAQQILKEKGLGDISVEIVKGDPNRERGKENYLWLRGVLSAEHGIPIKLQQAVSEIEDRTKLPVDFRYKEKKRDHAIVLFSIPQFNRYEQLLELNASTVEAHGVPWIPIDDNCDFLEDREFKHGPFGDLDFT